MTMTMLLLTWILWLVIGALILRWIVGGTIDCFKHGSKASIISWMGFTIGIIIAVVLTLAITD